MSANRQRCRTVVAGCRAERLQAHLKAIAMLGSMAIIPLVNRVPKDCSPTIVGRGRPREAVLGQDIVQSVIAIVSDALRERSGSLSSE